MEKFNLLSVRNELSKCRNCNTATACCISNCELFDRAVEAVESGVLEVDICRGCSQYNNSCNGYEHGAPSPFNPSVKRKPIRECTGTLFTSSIRKAKTFGADEIWLISRGGNKSPGFKHVRELAPSEMLFRKYLTSWKEKPGHLWWEKYRAQYLKQFQNPHFILKLALLYQKVANQGMNIVITCFCENKKYCHRSLIASFLAKKGLPVQNH